MIKPVNAAAIAILLAATSLARADECTDAVLDYNAVLSRLTDAMERFHTCIADSKGTDTCTKEFGRLSAAHDQFVSAVTIYIKQCR